MKKKKRVHDLRLEYLKSQIRIEPISTKEEINTKKWLDVINPLMMDCLSEMLKIPVLNDKGGLLK